jgi:predicted DNA-binding transcriptional regulator YafY
MSESSLPPITFHYTNHRGQCALRKAIPVRVVFEATEWHPEPQWILYAYDVEKHAERGFALRDCEFTRLP